MSPEALSHATTTPVASWQNSGGGKLQSLFGSRHSELVNDIEQRQPAKTWRVQSLGQRMCSSPTPPSDRTSSRAWPSKQPKAVGDWAREKFSKNCDGSRSRHHGSLAGDFGVVAGIGLQDIIAIICGSRAKLVAIAVPALEAPRFAVAEAAVRPHIARRFTGPPLRVWSILLSQAKRRGRALIRRQSTCDERHEEKA